MSINWIEAIDARSAAALASGALVPVEAEQVEMDDAGMRFIVRWVSSLAAKDASRSAAAAGGAAEMAGKGGGVQGAAARAEGAGAEAARDAKTVAIPGGPRDPNFNPFLNPDPELTVGPVGDAHVAILNKFPLCARHLVLARRAFEEQLLPLARSDFAALAALMVEAGGIGLYNGGTAAGASQRHKHVQWMPDDAGNASLRLFAPGLPAGLAEQGVATHPALPMRHCFVRVRCGRGEAVEAAADSLHAGFERARTELGLAQTDRFAQHTRQIIGQVARKTEPGLAGGNLGAIRTQLQPLLARFGHFETLARRLVEPRQHALQEPHLTGDIADGLVLVVRTPILVNQRKGRDFRHRKHREHQQHGAQRQRIGKKPELHGWLSAPGSASGAKT